MDVIIHRDGNLSKGPERSPENNQIIKLNKYIRRSKLNYQVEYSSNLNHHR